MAPLPPTDVKAVDAILELLKEGQTFCLSGHQNPDGDVIGSELALASLIRRLDPKKHVEIQNFGHVPKNVQFLDGAGNIKNVDRVEGFFDVVIVFECSGADRMGNIIDFSTQAGRVINIDHHLHNPNFGHVNFVEPHTSSTAELIFKIFERSGLPLKTSEAIAMYTGMVMDTGWFRYGNTNGQTQRIAAALLDAGVPVADLSERVYLSRSRTAISLLAWVLSHLKLYHDERVAVLRIPEDVFKEIGCAPDDAEEIVNYGLQIDSVRASALLKEKKSTGQIKVSLRSKGETDINQVARQFGGGGHKNASGCGLSTSLDEAEKLIAEALRRVV